MLKKNYSENGCQMLFSKKDIQWAIKCAFSYKWFIALVKCVPPNIILEIEAKFSQCSLYKNSFIRGLILMYLCAT